MAGLFCFHLFFGWQRKFIFRLFLFYSRKSKIHFWLASTASGNHDLHWVPSCSCTTPALCG